MIKGFYTETLSLIHISNRCILSSDAMNKDYWWNLAREIVWMGYSESLFLKAEAALRWPSLVDETAEALYLKGIKASMDYYEIDADKANEYISHLDGVKACLLYTSRCV